jgi:hypothetical protein
MAFASGTRVVLGYVEEVTRGTTPATPTLKTLRTIGRNVNLEKNILESAEVRSSRQRSDVRHGFNQVAGTPGFQLSLADYDDFLEYTMGGAWAAFTTGTGTYGSTSPDKFTRAAGSFVTDGFRPGDIITTSGYVTDNGQFRVLAVAALELTVEEQTVTGESGSGDEEIQVNGERIDVGTTLKTVTLERQFQDLTQYQAYTGVAVQQMQMTISPEAIVGGTFTLLGMGSNAMSGSSVSAGGPTAAPDNSPFAAFDGSMHEGGAAVAVATAIDFTINNQRTLQAVIGSKFSPDVFEGTAIITGNVSFIFETNAIYNKFFNETETSMWVKLDDLNGTDFMNIVFHRVKYTGNLMDPGQEGPVIQSGTFEALENTTYGTALSIQKSNV